MRPNRFHSVYWHVTNYDATAPNTAYHWGLYAIQPALHLSLQSLIADSLESSR